MQGLPYIKRQFDFSKILDIDQFNQQFEQIPKNNVSLEIGESLSSVGYLQPHTLPEFKNFFPFLKEIYRLFYPEQTDPEGCITRSWTNRHLRTGQTTEHRHEGVELVLSCYLNVPENSGAFEFYYNGQWHTVPVQSNDVLIFSGTLLHRTEVSQSDLPRIVVTMNITESLRSSQYLENLRTDPNQQPNVDELHREFVNLVGRISDAAARIEVQLLEME
jgi:hypothetical protein